MGYFLSEGSVVNVSEMRGNADTLGGSTTLTFLQNGSYYLKVDSPKIGEKFALLSDVTVIDAGPTGIIQNVAQLKGLHLYQVFTTTDAVTKQVSYGLSLVSTFGVEQDAVLGARFPTYSNNSTFETATVTPGFNFPNYLNEFYIAATGGRGVFDEVYGQFGLDAPYDGRTLLTRGSITGERDMAWGNWLDRVQLTGQPVEPPPNMAGLPGVIQDRVAELQASSAQTQLEIDAKLASLDRIEMQLASAKALLTAQKDVNQLELLSLVLNGAVTVSSTIELFLPEKLPLTKLVSMYKSVSLTNGANGVFEASKEVVGEPTVGNTAKLSENVASFLMNASNYNGALKSFIDIKQTVNQYETTYKNVETYKFSSNQIKETIESIQYFEQRKYNLEQEVIKLRNMDIKQQLDVIKIQSTSSTMEFGSSAAKAVIGVGDRQFFELDGLSEGKLLSFAFDGHDQKAKASSGTSIVDGLAASLDTLVMTGTRASFHETNAGDKMLVLEKGSTSTTAIGVDRIQFDDGQLALDVGTGENAGNAYRIYKAAFDREPDQQGVTFWTKWLDDGKTDTWNMAARFIDSNEFRALYGSSTPDNADYLLKVYQNVLDRNPEAEGYNWWLARLNDGTFSQSEVLARFSDSVENRENVAPTIEQGFFLSNEYFLF